jgi:hypothetical protein
MAISEPEYDAVAKMKEEEEHEALLDSMGLSLHEANYLRTTMLSADEAVSAKSEELTRIKQHKGRRSDWEELADAKARMGRPMHHSEFIRKLRIIVPSLIVANGRKRGTLSLYMVRSTPVKEVPDYKGPERTNFSCPVYIGWIHSGDMPEYEIDLIDGFQCPIGQKRGWRTILLRMIARWNKRLDKNGEPDLDIWGTPIRVSRGSIITEEQAHAAFGAPSNGITASNYRRQLFEFRNAYPEVVIRDRD